MRNLALACITVMAGGCNTGPPMDVKQYWFPAASPYGLAGSYAWVKAKDDDGYNPDYQRLLQEHVDRVLGEKGYLLTDTEKADFWVRSYFGRSARSVDTGHESFDQATVVIEALQQGSATVLWRGLLETRIAYHLPPIKRRERLKIGVERIFKDFPPPRDSSGDE